jgi:hypothetical protein
MAFTVEDLSDLVTLLSRHPEWRAQLRPLILGDEFLEVPGRLDRIEAILQQLVERQAAFEEHQTAFEERQAAFERDLSELVLVAKAHEARLNRIDGRLGNIEGHLLEVRYFNRVGSWLGKYLRRPRLVHLDDLDELEHAVEAGRLGEGEMNRLREADLLVRGTRRDDGADVLFAAEVSQIVNLNDVARADLAAGILRKAGYNAHAFVGGYRISSEAAASAEQRGVIVDLHPSAEPGTADLSEAS